MTVTLLRPLRLGLLRSVTQTLATLCLALWAGPLLAEPHHHDHERESSIQHESHVHGMAELLVVLEGAVLNIEFRSPAMNVVGFEHRAKTREQKAAVKQARTRLADGENLFEFGPERCELIEQDVSVGDLLDDHHHEETDDSPRHSDIIAAYQFSCRQADTLKSFSTHLPKIFDGVESLQVQWIVHGRQGSAKLNNSRSSLTFR